MLLGFSLPLGDPGMSLLVLKMGSARLQVGAVRCGAVGLFSLFLVIRTRLTRPLLQLSKCLGQVIGFCVASIHIFAKLVKSDGHARKIPCSELRSFRRRMRIREAPQEEMRGAGFGTLENSGHSGTPPTAERWDLCQEAS